MADSTPSAKLPMAPVEAPAAQAVNVPLPMAAHFIVLNITPGDEAEDTVKAFFGNTAALIRSVVSSRAVSKKMKP